MGPQSSLLYFSNYHFFQLPCLIYSIYVELDHKVLWTQRLITSKWRNIHEILPPKIHMVQLEKGFSAQLNLLIIRT